ncbi:hypothetical protein [Nocardia sp. XZ_19_231]|uniref:hypothetical protein n=1 Tax=Nocardia sp. XZ_19_231 TaxID=2769252 RepID=UPI00188F2685|nr:hypothetical protein [Nocardia sp. XZ_19_231]
MDLVKKLPAIAILLLILFGTGAGLAAAQPTPTTEPTPATSTPAPTTTPRTSAPATTPSAPTTSSPLPTAPSVELPGYANEDNEYTQTREECKELVEVNIDAGPLTDIVNGAIEGVNTWGCNQVAVTLHPIDAASTAISSAVSLFWGDPVGKFSKAVMEGNVNAFHTVMAFWIQMPVSLVDTAKIDGIQSFTWDLQIFALAFGIGTGALRVAIARRHAVSEGADETARMLVRTLFSIWTLPTMVLVLHQVTDAFSVWVLTESMGGDPNARITALTWIDEKTGLGPVVSLVLAGVGLLGSVAQLVAMFVREAILTLAVGLAPIAAAASATGAGRQTWSSMISYTIAALLFKPVAALLYAFAFTVAQSESAFDAIAGSILLAFAGLALPSLIRVIAPAVSTISAGGGQVAALAGGAAGAAATGAAMGGSAARGAGSFMKSFQGSGGSSGGGGGGGAPASGSVGSSGGGGGGRGGGGSGGGGGSNGGGGGGRARQAAGVAGTAATGVGVALSRGASAMRAPARGVSGMANFAEGAVGHGQVPR